MSSTVNCELSVTGFDSTASRDEFRGRYREGHIAFSLNRVRPLPPPHPIELEHSRQLLPDQRLPTRSGIELKVQWTTFIYFNRLYTDDGFPEVEVSDFLCGDILGLFVKFAAKNTIPINAIRSLSKDHPQLLFRCMVRVGDNDNFDLLTCLDGERHYASHSVAPGYANPFTVTTLLNVPETWYEKPYSHDLVLDWARSAPPDDGLEEEINREREKRLREMEESIRRHQDWLSSRSFDPDARDNLPF